MARQYKPRIPGVIYVSPSQIQTKRDCRRKWAYRYIEKIKTPQKPTQAFGSEGHDRVEEWLKNGKHPGDDDVGLVVQQGIKPGYLPTPSPELLVEQYLEIPLFDGKAMMIGYMDCGIRPVPGIGGDLDEPPIVHDWKFTKDLRWAMTVEELRADAQSAVYGKWALDAFEVNEVFARWVYFCGRVTTAKNADGVPSPDGRPRKPRGVKKVEHLFPRAELDELWEGVLDDAHEIVQMHANFKTAAEVPPDESHCDAYGGCDHRAYCPLSESAGLGAALEQYDRTHKLLTRRINGDIDTPDTTETTMSSNQTMMELLQNRPKTNGGVPSNAAPAATEVPAMFAKAPVEPTPEPQAEAPAEPAAAPTPEPQADVPAEPVGEIPAMFANMTKGGEVPAMFANMASVTPASEPQAKAPVAAAASIPEPQAEAPVEPATPGSFMAAMQAQQGAQGVNPPGDFKAEPQAEAPAEPATPPAESSGDGAAAAEVPVVFGHLTTARTPADSPNVSNAPKAEPKTEVQPATAPVAETKTSAKSKSKRQTKAEKATKGMAVDTAHVPFVVAYNSIPAVVANGFGEIVQLGDLIAPLLEHIAKEHRCKEHPNGVAHWNLIEYGNGKSVLAHLFAQSLDAHPFKGILVVDGNTAEGIAVKEVLMRRADFFVQGVR